MKRDSRRLLVAAIAVCAAAALSSCSSDKEPSIPQATGPDPGLVLQVDCGDTGIGVVKISYGTSDTELLVGQTAAPSEQTVDTLSRRYGLLDEDTEGATLVVSTKPTRGTCKTSLTDYNSGDVLGEKETAGKVELSAFVPAG